MPVYLDNCATTKPYPEVIEKIVSALSDSFGNPSSLHNEGQLAKEVLEESRKTVASALGVSPDTIVFTSGGTEANNLAILGLCGVTDEKKGHIVSTTVEHPAVHKPLRHLQKNGWAIDYIPVKQYRLDLNIANDVIKPQTTFASVMLVNNETGTIMPVREVKNILSKIAPSALLHCDAVQGFGNMAFSAESLGADLISVSAHKIHGPKGVGALYIREGVQINRRVFGGDQEKGIRSGTEAVPLIAGFAEAVRITMSNLKKNSSCMSKLKNHALRRLPQLFPDVILNSQPDSAPHIISFSLPGLNNAEAANYLSEKGICISTSAACKSNHRKGPSMLMSFGLPAELADSTLRVGLCGENTEDEIESMMFYLKQYRQEGATRCSRAISPV